MAITKIADFYNIYIGSVKKLLKKLVKNYFDNKNYDLQYENLQFHLRLGLKLKKKIHCVLEFNQSQWLKPFIELKTRKE